MPSVLHILTRFQRGGTERNVLHYIDWERRAGYDTHIAVGNDTLFDELPSYVPCHPIPTLVRSPHPLNDVRAFLHLRRLIESHQFDVVHTHQSKAGVLGRLAAGGRTSAIVHTVHMSSFGAGYGRAASLAFLRAERFCARSSDVIVTVGEDLRRSYLGAGISSASKYVVIRSPIEIGRYLAVRGASAEERLAAQMRFGLVPSEASQVIVNVGALEPRKRQQLLLVQLAPFLREGRARLLVAGAGPERSSLKALAEQLGIDKHVSLVGFIEDVDRLLMASDILVHTASSEGTPQVVVQALAAGRPVVATEACGLREVAGASVAIVGALGDGLLSAVRSALRCPPPVVPPSAFEPWREPTIEQQIALLHDKLPKAGAFRVSKQ